MHQIGLKLWSVNQNYIDEARRLFLEGVYDYIELYVVPESLELIDFWKELKIPYIIHAPHYGNGLNLADPRKVSENINLAEQTFRYADELCAENIIFHPGISGHIEETARQLSQIKDSRILLENKPYRSFDGQVCVGSRPEEIEYVMKECDIGCCFDIGHAICAANSHKIDRKVFIGRFVALEPSVYHLSDGDVNSEFDSHEHLGDGNYDLKGLFCVLPPNSTISIETKKDSGYDLEDFKKDVENLRIWI